MDIRPIRTKADHRRALKEIEGLMGARRSTPRGGGRGGNTAPRRDLARAPLFVGDGRHAPALRTARRHVDCARVRNPTAEQCGEAAATDIDLAGIADRGRAAGAGKSPFAGHEVVVTDPQRRGDETAADMRVVVGIASGAGQRAFAGNFDRKHGSASAEDTSPGRKQFSHGHSGP